MLFPEEFHRRTFLCALAAWVGTAAILPVRLARRLKSVPQRGLPSVPGDGNPGNTSTGTSTLDRTSAAIFEHHVGSAFRIVAGSAGAPHLVHLTRVTRLQSITWANGEARESTPAFSLIFRGPVGPVLGQDTYLVKHSHLGEFPLFLVPIGPNQAAVRYEAVFA